MAYAQITRAQLRARVQEQLGAAATTFWTTDELNRIIQEALRVFNACTGFWKTRLLINTTITGGIPDVWYTLGGTITSGMRVSFNGVPLTQSSFIPFPSTSLSDLDSGRKYWESEKTDDGGDVPTTPTCWGVGAINVIGIWPADYTGAGQLQVDGVASTPILTADGDYVDIGVEEVNILLDYCQHIAMFKEGGAEFEATTSLLQSFLGGCAQRNGLLMLNSKFRGWMGVESRKPTPPERIGGR